MKGVSGFVLVRTPSSVRRGYESCILSKCKVFSYVPFPKKEKKLLLIK